MHFRKERSLQLFHHEVVCRCNVRMLVALKLLSCVLWINLELVQHHEYFLIYLYIGISYIDARPNRLFLRAILLVPIMVSNSLDWDSLVWIRGQDFVQEVFCERSHEVWHFKLPCEDFLIEFCCVRVFERKVPTDHGIENDASAPDVYLCRLVLLARYHLRRSVAWWTTCRFQKLMLWVNIAKSKVNNL